MTQERKNVRPSLLLCAALLLLAALVLPTAAADTLVTVESRQTVTVEGQAQPERSHTAQIWIGDDAIARDDAEIRTVLTGDELLLISHRDRKYNRLKLPIDPVALAPPEMREQAGRRLAEAKLSGELTPGEETQEVGDWTARRYDLQLTSEGGMSVDMVLWASAEIEADAASYNALTRALASMQLGGGDWVELLAGVEGFPVLRETTMSNEVLEVVSTERVISVEEQEAPAGIYGPPVGYAEVEVGAAAEEAAAATSEEDGEDGEMEGGDEMEEMEETEEGEGEAEGEGEGG